ncbi:putative 2OG-Fe(II) oxygenase [Maricaulis sp. CAU 1757]
MSAALQQAAGLLQQGRAEAAIGLLDDWLATRPDDPEALQLRGMARGRLGQHAAALADMEAALKRHAQPHAVLNNTGNLHRRHGDLGAARQAYEAALEQAPEFVDARYNLGLCLGQAGEAHAAMGCHEQVLAAQPGHAGALTALAVLKRSAGDHAAALELLERALKSAPGQVAARLHRTALLRELGQAEAALADADAACRLAPRLAEAHAQRAHTLRTLNRTTEARQAYQDAIGLAPARADLHRDLAGLVWEMGQGDAALTVLDAVLARQPDPELWLVRARHLRRTGEAPAAVLAVEAALAMAPQHAEALALRGELRAGKEGLEDLRRAVELTRGDDFAVRHALAERLLAADLTGEALDLLEGEAPPEHLQKHVALQATAWRCAGDARYGRVYDYDRLTCKRFIDVPPGFASLDAFNAELGQRIARLHATEAQPVEQTLYGGTQSPGRLWNSDDPVIQALAKALLDTAGQFVDGLPQDPEHPFLRRRTGKLELAGAWSVRLRSGGGHVDHIHPAGWISASYYVEVPDSVLTGEKAGWLRLGAPGIAGLDLPAERYIKPEAGAVILFPSYMWHGVEPFEADTVRVTAPFDLLPG